MSDKDFTMRHDVSLEDLRKGIKLETGRRHIIRVPFYTIRVRLDIDPNDESSQPSAHG